MNIENQLDSFLGFIDSNIDEIKEVKKEKALEQYNNLMKKLDRAEKQLIELDSTYDPTRIGLENLRKDLNDVSKWSLKLVETILRACLYIEYQLGTHRGL